jgi:hypothetical protein
VTWARYVLIVPGTRGTRHSAPLDSSIPMQKRKFISVYKLVLTGNSIFVLPFASVLAALSFRARTVYFLVLVAYSSRTFNLRVGFTALLPPVIRFSYTNRNSTDTHTHTRVCACVRACVHTWFALFSIRERTFIILYPFSSRVNTRNALWVRKNTSLRLCIDWAALGTSIYRQADRPLDGKQGRIFPTCRGICDIYVQYWFPDCSDNFQPLSLI